MFKKTYRGGCWGKAEELVKSIWRGKNHPATHFRSRGLRPVRNVKEKE